MLPEGHCRFSFIFGVGCIRGGVVNGLDVETSLLCQAPFNVSGTVFEGYWQNIF